jgi:NADH-quinone oxidoreductase subunit L
MTDIKRVLAYSTISQYGLMMVALGVGGYTAALFHLFTHAFFKALLFLAAGSVIHGTDRQDVQELGGLRRAMPVTALTFGAGALALAGFPLTAGFWSKDEILNAAGAAGGLWPAALVVILLLSAALTAFYAARLFTLIFLGRPRDPAVHAHESPPVMLAPLVVFAALSLLAGFLALPLGWPGIGHFGHVVYAHGPEEFHFNPALALISAAGALLGMVAGWGVYARGWLDPAAVRTRFGGLHRLLAEKYYLDHGYQWLIDHGALVLARLVAVFDRRVVNDLGVDGPAAATVEAGEQLRYHETGKVYTYAWVMAVGVVVLFVIVRVAQR